MHNKDMHIICSGHEYPVYGVTWSPDGTRLATGSRDGTVRIWDAETGQPLRICGEVQWRVMPEWMRNIVRSVAWSADGARLAAAENHNVQLWDPNTGQRRKTYQKHRDRIWTVVWSPDSACLASSSLDGYIHIWKATTLQTLLRFHGQSEDVRSLAWSPDGTRLASSGGDGTAKVWDASTGQLLFMYQGHQGEVWAVAWSPNGKYLAAAAWDGMKIWDASTGQPHLDKTYRDDYLVSVSWSPDSTQLVTASLPGMLHIIDTTTGYTLRSFSGHTGEVHAVAWSPNGVHIASVSEDRTLRVWTT